MATETATRNQPAHTTKDAERLPDLTKFEEAKHKIERLGAVMNDLGQTAKNNRDLRYTRIDVEAERKSGRLLPDELFIPQHIIDSNIRREQAKYVAYVSSARRAAILHDVDDPTNDTALVEMDFTTRFRYDGWQTPWYRYIDGMQQNGYGVMEMVNDVTMPGHLKLQDVPYEDFGYPLDTRDIQSAEMVTRKYRFTKTQLMAMVSSKTWNWNREQVLKVVTAAPNGETNDFKETSLFTVEKVMFRRKGVVMVAWSCYERCDDWLREPRPLYLGRLTLDPMLGTWVKAFETVYPYFVAPYNISENTVLRQCMGRAYMDQDTQNAVTSLISTYVTAHRRAGNLYFAVDGEGDPNAGDAEQGNIYLKPGFLIKQKIKQFQLTPPDAGMLTATHAVAGMNMQENSQIDYAANNRKDSRKTATEIQAAQTEAQLLSTIQLALFSTAMKEICTAFFEIVRSRVVAGYIETNDVVRVLYGGNYQVRPAGDVDVIEKQEKILRMQQTWPVVQQTGAAQVFLAKLLTLMFPEDAPTYNALIQQDGAKTTMLASLAQVLQGLIADPGQLSPQAQQHIPEIQQLLMQVGQAMGVKAPATPNRPAELPMAQSQQQPTAQQQ